MGSKPNIYLDNYQEVYLRPPHFFDDIVKRLFRISSPSNQQILDIGCGFGDFLDSVKRINKKSKEFYGLTIAPHEAQDIKKNKKFINITIGKQQDLLRHYNTTFDCIASFHTLSYVNQDQQKKTTKQMLSLLKSNGLLVLGFLPDWIKISSKVSQQGKGYCQFFYSPFLFPLLAKDARLVDSFKEERNKYLIQVWKKKTNISYWNRAEALGLSYFFILRNNILQWPFLRGIGSYLIQMIQKRGKK